MKKIMIAALLLMAGGAFAKEAQVYEMTMTIKTTTAKSGKVKPALCEWPNANAYRKSATIKIKGVIWGCDCETIGEPEPLSNAVATAGYVFWNETTHEIIDSGFGWKLFNRIEKNAKKVEGTWTLATTNGNFCLMGGGIGTIKDETIVDGDYCDFKQVMISSMSGNVAGWMLPSPVIVQKGSEEVCEKCEVKEGISDVVIRVPGWTVCCKCGEGADWATAWGTWKLKYSPKYSKKWASVSADTKITDVYPAFPSYVRDHILSK